MSYSVIDGLVIIISVSTDPSPQHPNRTGQKSPYPCYYNPLRTFFFGHPLLSSSLNVHQHTSLDPVYIIFTFNTSKPSPPNRHDRHNSIETSDLRCRPENKSLLTFLRVTVNSAWQPVQLKISSLQTQQFVLRTLRSNASRSAFFHSRLLSLLTAAYSNSISTAPSIPMDGM